MVNQLEASCVEQGSRTAAEQQHNSSTTAAQQQHNSSRSNPHPGPCGCGDSVLQTRLRRRLAGSPCQHDGYAPTPPQSLPIAPLQSCSIPLLPPTTMARHFNLTACSAPDRLIYFCSPIHWISQGIALACLDRFGSSVPGVLPMLCLSSSSGI